MSVRGQSTCWPFGKAPACVGVYALVVEKEDVQGHSSVFTPSCGPLRRIDREGIDTPVHRAALHRALEVPSTGRYHCWRDRRWGLSRWQDVEQDQTTNHCGDRSPDNCNEPV